ncbi:unnamed protein product [Orchesella dallaii]|uniref:PNPLA domain-containing protein n=1 Tax=Orchesella dallaii TaxID=48710 RepID=A0ABP1QZ63_9HEXA
MTNKTKFNLSFAGCGFLGIYHVGVAACLKKYAPHLVVNKASGASAGAIAACCLLCDAPLGQITRDVLRIATLARAKTLGPFSPSFNIQKILRDGLEKILPEDAHLRVTGKLHISLTRVYDRQNVIVSQFNTREELIQAILSSGFIPIFSGWLPPKFQGVRYMDGCYSDNLPILDENTITVSPFCGESDICPRDKTVNLMQVNLSNTSIELSRQNLYRFSRTLFPPKAEILSKMCQQGFDDTLRFLARNDLIGCVSCMTMEPPMSLGEELDEMAAKNYEKIMSEESCHQCKAQKQAALLDSLPETVVTILQDAIESGNKGLFNWLFSHQSVRLLSLMTLPCLLPADMAYATALKIFETAPKLTYNLKVLSEAVLQLVARTLANISLSPATYSAKLTCQVAITEYSEDIESPDQVYIQRKPSILNKMNFGFTLNIDNCEALPAAYQQCNSRQHQIDLGEHDDDTFERVLTVTSHQDALMACYYLDHCDNKVEITEVFQVDDIDELTPASIITEIHQVEVDDQSFPTSIETYSVNELQAIQQNGNGEIIVN